MVISDTETGKILLYMLEELLEHQKELANQLEGETKRIRTQCISDTETGKILLYTLEELLEHQKELANQLEGKTIAQIPNLQVPVGVKTKRFFDLRS